MAPPERETGSGPLKQAVVDAAFELLGESGRGGAVSVEGASMEPTLVAGQRVWGEFSPARPRRGDVLLFRQGDHVVVHRLLGPARPVGGAPAWRCRGDGKIVLDPPLTADRILGRVTAVEDGPDWRSLVGGGPRVYALALAAHGLCWWIVSLVARSGERACRKVFGAAPPLVEALARIDKGLLTVAHRLLFRRIHRRIPPPFEAAGSSATTRSPV